MPTIQQIMDFAITAACVVFVVGGVIAIVSDWRIHR